MTYTRPARRHKVSVFAALAALMVFIANMAPAYAAPKNGSANNPVPVMCPIDWMVVVDRSNSILASDMDNDSRISSAIAHFVDRLSTAPAVRVGGGTFASVPSGYVGSSPTAPTTLPDDFLSTDFPTHFPFDSAVQYPSVDFTDITDPAGAAKVKSWASNIVYNEPAVIGTDARARLGWTDWTSALGGTSTYGSDVVSGLTTVGGDTPGDADVVVFITDGNPTLPHSPPSVTTANGDKDDLSAGTLDADVDSAIDAADALKAGGTRIVAVGVGDVDEDNLARITHIGPGHAVKGSDYVLIDDFDQLADALGVIATNNCFTDVELTKQVDANGDGVFSDEEQGVRAGPVTWRLTVDSKGTVAATGVVVSDPLLANRGCTPTASQGTWDESSGVWTVGSVPSEASATLDLACTFTPEFVAAVQAVDGYNVAQVSAMVEDDIDSTPNNIATPYDPTGGEDDEARARVTFAPLQTDLPSSPPPPPPGPERLPFTGNLLSFTGLLVALGVGAAALVLRRKLR